MTQPVKKSAKASSKQAPRIKTLIKQLNNIAEAQVDYMSFYPPIADQIVIGLAQYLGEDGCTKISNNQDDFSFDDEYGHEGLGVEAGRFRIPLMVRIRDHESCGSTDCPVEEDEADTQSKNPKKKTKKSKKKSDIKLEKAETAKVKKSKKKKKSKKSKKALKKALEKELQEKALADKDHTAVDCSETFLRFKLLFERKNGKLIVNIAGTKKITVDPDDLEPLYEAIFIYLKAYFSVEKFFDKTTKSYQNASYGFFRKHF